MARKLYQTMTDYVVIAVSPALIMTLVGSLVFFLLAVFYRGEYSERLWWVMACFVFAAVLIGRISIEEGFERAAPFGIALAVVVGMAANSFMEFHGRWIDSIGWIVNWGLIALVWWCAHRLTWDCTVIDDSQDASGEGLLQVAGLERRDAAARSADTHAMLEGTTSRQVPSGWWQRYVEHQRRPHAPGVWVVYFSLAALPLFGLGGWFIPASATGLRRTAFWLLCIYVGSGLGLLLTTSFLGLRRYLRQRRIEMPTTMANLWLGMGAAVIVALLVFAALLPRPSAEYAISELPISLGSPSAKASKYAPVPKEGVHDEQPGEAPQRQDDENKSEGNDPSQENAQPDQSSEPQSAGDAPQQDEQDSKQGNSDGGGGKSGQGGQAGSAAGKGSKSGGRSQSRSGQSAAARQKADKSEPSSPEPSSSQQKDNSEQSKNAEPQEPDSQRANDNASQTSPPAPQPVEMPPSIEAPLGMIGEILKWAFYAVLALAVLYALWRFRAEVAAAIRDFVAGLRDFWAGLWGRRRNVGSAADEPVEIKIPPAPFSTYADPFATGIAGRYSLEELVRYSFEAFEAWAREHGSTREPDQTPHELAREVTRRNAFIAADARHIAELYSRAAYARGELPDAARDQLRQLWQTMRRASGEPRPSISPLE